VLSPYRSQAFESAEGSWSEHSVGSDLHRPGPVGQGCLTRRLALGRSSRVHLRAC